MELIPIPYDLNLTLIGDIRMWIALTMFVAFDSIGQNTSEHTSGRFKPRTSIIFYNVYSFWLVDMAIML